MKLSIISGVVLALFAGSAMAQAAEGPGRSTSAHDRKLVPDQVRQGRPRGQLPTTRKNSANIKRALATVKQYKSITIGKYYHREAPAFGARGWQMTIPGTPTGGPFGKNALIYHDELVDNRNRPDPDAVRRSRPYRREHLEGPDVLQRPSSAGMPTSAARAAA